VTDFDGESIRREYNVLNRPSKVIDKEGRETLLTYDSMWNLARVTAPDGARTTYLYNEENLLSRIKYADGAVVRYTYDANGNRIGEEDENGAKTTFVYDALGRVVEVNGEEGLHYAYRYDGEGNLIEAEDALGNRVSMEYDGNGNLIKETNQLGESRSYAYTPLGDVESITDEAGRITCYRYQKGGLLEKIRYADGTEEAFTYDANGNLETHTLATGFVLTYGYDSMDRIVEIMGSEGERKSYTYDALGNVTSMTDGEGNTTWYAYTLSGQLAKVTDALGNETEYQYDVCDRLIEIRQYGAKESLKEDTEGSGMDADLLEAEKQNGRKRLCQITRYTRDLRGQVTETMDALGQKETYTYDKKGQLLGKLDKEGYLTKYAYTKQGDLSGIQYADGKEVKLSYNPLRQLIEIQDWLGNTRITPDALGRAEKVQYPDGREVSYTYGKAGERRSITYPDGKTVFYGYDEQLRLSELKEGDSVITYGYDPVGRLCEKQFPNGTKTTYRYDRKDQLTELVHQDKEGILDRYTYLYDLLGNKTGITKERRGLERESGHYRYGYDALGRLSEIQKDGEIQYRYGYDAFGNRTWKEESGEQTSYQYNALNQLVSERQGKIRKEYGYDKRGNLTRILENGAWKKQYIYGAMNRMEEAVDAAGKQARYQYNGLGHRVGKQEGVLPKEKLEKLDPQRRVGMEIGNSRQITYTLDLTRQYYNLLERTEESQSQRYFWDGNVAAYEENGERNYYLQDELGSPLRIEDSAGTIKESYGYGAFGEDLYQNQGEMQPFGYTGYQRDEIAGTYYAQAREYLAESGRFAGQDLIAGFMDLPFSMNRYSYCFNTPVVLVDLDGAWPKWITDIGGAIDEGVQWVENKVSSAIRWGYEEIWSKHIYGEDLVLYETTTGGGSYEVTSHRGGSIIVAQKDILGNFTGWTLDLSINLPHGLKVGSKLTGKDWNPETWKYNHGIEYTNQDTGISYKGGTYMDKNGIGYNHVYGGTSGNLPLELPDSTKIDEYADVSWSFSQDFQISNWKLILETVGVVTAAILFVVVVLDDATIVGVLDDAALAPLAAYIASVAPSFYQWFINSAPKMATCGG
ncbi:RHS repeat-associated core domain-containing protein, partial [Mediterraneibacter faecis]|uniref:RHS repeat-associated core domain-containing protein n=1 Tax=Mediterraneibacter faecis TaxID=592978 RepID=UPI0029C9D3DB